MPRSGLKLDLDGMMNFTQQDFDDVATQKPVKKARKPSKMQRAKRLIKNYIKNLDKEDVGIIGFKTKQALNAYIKDNNLYLSLFNGNKINYESFFENIENMRIDEIKKATSSKIKKIVDDILKYDVNLGIEEGEEIVNKTIKEFKQLIENKYKWTTTQIFFFILDDNLTQDEIKDIKQKYPNAQVITYMGHKYIKVLATRIIYKNSAIESYEDSYTRKAEADRFYILESLILGYSDFAGSYGVYFSSALPDLIITKKINKSFATPKATDYNIEDEKLFNDDIDDVIMNKYIVYNQNVNAKTIGEIFQIDVDESQINNKKANSCFINLILETYKKDFDKVDGRGKKRIKGTIDYQILCDIMEIKNDDQKIGLTIRESMKFFKKYNLGLRVINAYNEIIFEDIPEKPNTHFNTTVLNILVHNNHCYKITQHAVLRNQRHMKELNAVEQLKASPNYLLPIEHKYPEENKVYMLSQDLQSSMQTIKEVLRTTDTSKAGDIYFVYNNVLENILFELIKEKITPEIKTCGNMITRITLTLGKKCNFHINSCSFQTPDNIMMCIENKDVVLNFWKQYNIFSCGLFSQDNLSHYHESTLNIFETYKIHPIIGAIDKKYVHGNGIDERKAYTKKFYDMEFYPVLNYFDIFVKYDGEKIEQYNQYIIEVITDDDRTKILFGSKYTRCYGNTLMNIAKDIKYKVMYVLRPSKLIKANCKQLIDNLYAVQISEDEDEDTLIKKNIVNYVSGMSEKKNNVALYSTLFKNFEEANYYNIKYGGDVMQVCNYEFTEEEYNEAEDPMNFGIECENKINKSYVSKVKDQLYVHTVRKEAKLINGFRPIKDWVYDAQRLTMYKRYMEAVKKGLHPIGMRTDCIIVSDKKSEVMGKYNWKNEIGGYKFESQKANPTNMLEMIPNELIEFYEPKVNVIELKDEFNREEMNEIMDKNNNLVVLGSYAGVGKTTAIKNYNASILFITPFNKLAKQLRKDGCEAITLNKLLGIYADGQDYANMKKFDVSEYEVICFDEMMMYDSIQLRKIYKFMTHNADKKFMATGDLNQLKPFKNNLNNVVDMAKYYEHCHNIMFPNKLHLKVNKRLKSEEDKQKMIDLKRDIFDTKINIMDTFRKYGIKIVNNMADVKTLVNVCYFNFRCNNVNNHIYKQVKKPNEKTFIDGRYYFEGQILTCKKHYQSTHIRLYINYDYKIKELKDDTFIIVDDVDDVEIELDYKMMSHFKLPYANTCHSVQGLTFDDKITIFDCNTPYIDRNYVYVALTRCTDLNNVQIFEHTEGENKFLIKSKIQQYFGFKVDEYMKQDLKAGRKIDEEPYADVEFISNLYHQSEECKHCPACNQRFVLGVIDGKVECNITLDRINNNKSHYASNCRLLCLDCNIARGNRYDISIC